jgi:hypothetical protein
MGYGNKYDVSQDSQVTPSCQKYRIKTAFDENTEKRRGHEIQPRGTVPLIQQLSSNPYISRELFKIPGIGNYHFEGKRLVTEASPVLLPASDDQNN